MPIRPPRSLPRTRFNAIPSSRAACRTEGDAAGVTPGLPPDSWCCESSFIANGSSTASVDSTFARGFSSAAGADFVSTCPSVVTVKIRWPTPSFSPSLTWILVMTPATVEGMGATSERTGHEPHPAVKELTDFFHSIASDGTPEEALAAFYAYESQVPRVAAEKARGLKGMYGADEKTYGYFSLHATADLCHAQVWRRQLSKCVEANPASAEKALIAGENAAQALWQALDGVEERRKTALAAA